MYAIGITGGPAAGKSTFAAALARALPDAQVISEDNYIFDIALLGGQPLSAVNFDDPATRNHALMLAHLRGLRSGAAVAVPVYDYATGRAAGEIQVLPRRCMIFEGIHLVCSPAFWRELDLRVFIDVPEARRLSRWISRNTRERGQTVEAARCRFLDHAAPMYRVHTLPARDRCELVLDGNLEHGPDNARWSDAIRAVAAHLSANAAGRRS